MASPACSDASVHPSVALGSIAGEAGNRRRRGVGTCMKQERVRERRETLLIMKLIMRGKMFFFIPIG